MRKARFLNERRPAWLRFEELLIKAEHPKAHRLTELEVSEFSELFRSLCYDLATVRSRDWGSGLDRYLNDLAPSNERIVTAMRAALIDWLAAIDSPALIDGALRNDGQTEKNAQALRRYNPLGWTGMGQTLE